MPAPDLVLNIRKPIGWTSFDVVRLVKNYLPRCPVGHAGTLDPFAQGVLLICTGKETKNIEKYTDADKEYRAGLYLGIETDTLDISGKIVATQQVPPLSTAQCMNAAKRFIGTIEQVPPRYSALKKNGQRWYHLARSGTTDAPEPRWVHIKEFEIVQYQTPFIHVRILCGKGTYVRSLLRDFAQALGCIGYTFYLTRTKIDGFQIEEAMEVTDIKQKIATV